MDYEDVDLYGDIPTVDLNEKIDKLQEESAVLSKKTEELNRKIDVLNKEKERLQKQNKILQKNISIVLKTAKHEIKRKCDVIDDLRKQIQLLELKLQTFRDAKYEEVELPENSEVGRGISEAPKVDKPKDKTNKENQVRSCKIESNVKEKSRSKSKEREHSLKERFERKESYERRSDDHRKRPGPGPRHYNSRRSSRSPRRRSRSPSPRHRVITRRKNSPTRRNRYDVRPMSDHNSRSRSPVAPSGSSRAGKRSKSRSPLGHSTVAKSVISTEPIKTSKSKSPIRLPTKSAVQAKPVTRLVTRPDGVKETCRSLAQPDEQANLEAAKLIENLDAEELEEGEWSDTEETGKSETSEKNTDWQESFKNTRDKEKPPMTLFSQRMAKRIESEIVQEQMDFCDEQEHSDNKTEKDEGFESDLIGETPPSIISEQPIQERTVPEHLINKNMKSDHLLKDKTASEHPLKGDTISDNRLNLVTRNLLEDLLEGNAISELPLKENTVVEQPINDNPVAEHTLAEKTISEHPLQGDTISDNRLKQNPVIGHLLRNLLENNAISQLPFKENTVVEQLLIENPVAEHTLAEKTISEQPREGNSISESRLKENTVVEHTLAEKTISERLIQRDNISDGRHEETPIVEHLIRDLFEENTISKRFLKGSKIFQQRLEKNLAEHFPKDKDFDHLVEEGDLMSPEVKSDNISQLLEELHASPAKVQVEGRKISNSHATDNNTLKDSLERSAESSKSLIESDTSKLSEGVEYSPFKGKYKLTEISMKCPERKSRVLNYLELEFQEPKPDALQEILTKKPIKPLTSNDIFGVFGESQNNALCESDNEGDENKTKKQSNDKSCKGSEKMAPKKEEVCKELEPSVRAVRSFDIHNYKIPKKSSSDGSKTEGGSSSSRSSSKSRKGSEGSSKSKERSAERDSSKRSSSKEKKESDKLGPTKEHSHKDKEKDGSLKKSNPDKDRTQKDSRSSSSHRRNSVHNPAKNSSKTDPESVKSNSASPGNRDKENNRSDGSDASKSKLKCDTISKTNKKMAESRSEVTKQIKEKKESQSNMTEVRSLDIHQYKIPKKTTIEKPKEEVSSKHSVSKKISHHSNTKEAVTKNEVSLKRSPSKIKGSDHRSKKECVKEVLKKDDKSTIESKNKTILVKSPVKSRSIFRLKTPRKKVRPATEIQPAGKSACSSDIPVESSDKNRPMGEKTYEESKVSTKLDALGDEEEMGINDPLDLRTVSTVNEPVVETIKVSSKPTRDPSPIEDDKNPLRNTGKRKHMEESPAHETKKLKEDSQVACSVKEQECERSGLADSTGGSGKLYRDLHLSESDSEPERNEEEAGESEAESNVSASDLINVLFSDDED